ncbi:MAG: HAD family phosphatase [Chloroflexi bacterium]|nr:HAD family phosphatase [Chloroflexota bacterium]
MDGVLVDGEPLHFRAVNQLLGEEGRSISLEDYKPYMGTKSGWSEMIRDLGLGRPKDYYSDRYRGLILDQYRTHSRPLPGAVEFVRALADAGIPRAVASSSIQPWVEACLDRLGLHDAFDVTVTGSDVSEGKPDPAIYLLAASRLGVDATKCLAIEDAPAGIQSARNAGMECWAVLTEFTRDLPLPDPHRVLESLLHVDLEHILGVPV